MVEPNSKAIVKAARNKFKQLKRVHQLVLRRVKDGKQLHLKEGKTEPSDDFIGLYLVLVFKTVLCRNLMRLVGWKCEGKLHVNYYIPYGTCMYTHTYIHTY